MDAKTLKIEAARAALTHVGEGMRLGIGTGSTAEEFVKLLAERVASGLSVIGVATSERTQALCEQLGVPMSTIEDTPHLDLTIDGADEVGPGLALIKGGGGALLREKIVAAASDRMLVIADKSKLVDVLGAYPLPIEVNRFGLAATISAIRDSATKLGLTGPLAVRIRDDEPFVTDGGHLIVDASFGRIPEPRALSAALHAIPGVVEHGLFLDLAKIAVIAGPGGIETLDAPPALNQLNGYGVPKPMTLFSIARRAALSSALIVLSFSAGAQEISEAHLKAARDAVAAIQATGMYDNILPQAAFALKQQLIQQNPDKQEVISKTVDEKTLEMVKRRADLEREAATAYAKVFPEEDLKNIATFYTSPTGKKLLADGPIVTREVIKAADIWQRGVARDLAVTVGDELKKLDDGAEGATPAPATPEAPATTPTPN